jgi:hypothetical protein
MSLRTKVLRGGVYLFVRLGLGMAISTVGVILLTRTIGPGAYGLYAAALGIYTYLTHLNAWCELPVEDLSRRCPQTRVGLLPDPEGKGTEFLCSI